MDYSQIESVLGLATTALGATGKAVSTVEAVKNLFSSDKTPDSTEATRLLNGLATELTAANMMNVQLSEALKVLFRQLKAQDEFDTEKARYELFETGEKDLVYKLREEAAQGQPMHFICPVCLNSDRLFSFVRGDGDYRTCQKNNDHMFRFKNTPMPVYRGRRGIVKFHDHRPPSAVRKAVDILWITC